MRHTLALASLGAVLALTGVVVDAIASRSPAPGLVMVWSSDPGQMLASLPAGQVRVVNTWWSGRLVQLHVDSMRTFDGPAAAAPVAIRLPQAGVVLAGCG